MIYRNDDFIYDSETGELIHARRKSYRTGPLCPCSSTPSRSHGYLVVRTNGKLLLQHRVIWHLVHGHWPKQVDHINGVRTDNRLCNLRDVVQLTNSRNAAISRRSTTRVCGIGWHKASSSWRVRIIVNYREIHLGTFSNRFDALAARKRAENHYGFHRNHGRLPLIYQTPIHYV